MSWLWGSRSSAASNPKSELDSDLRDFLENQTPIDYKPRATQQPKARPAAPKASESTEPAQKSETGLPAESLFQDGRYAHLWKNYRPLAEIEETNKSDQEKLMDVLEGFKDRKRSVGRMALENCSLEQQAIHDCYANGSVTEKLTLCRKQLRAFDRCYTIQAQFLKSLGYMSTYDRPASVDEEIQMHADTLYHRMLEHEKAIANAKAAGEPIPEEKPISLSAASLAAVKKRISGEEEKEDAALPPLPASLQEKIKPEAQLELRRTWKELTPEERHVLEKSKLSEYEVVMEIQRLRARVMDDRRQRRQEGKGTIGDTVSGWLGW